VVGSKVIQRLRRVALYTGVGLAGWTLPACRETKRATAEAKPSATVTVSGPRMVFDRTSYDFGVVVAGKPVRHLFGFRNTGDRVLLIGNVDSSCGCTGAVLKNREIAPGATGQIEVIFTAASSIGPTLKTVVVSSNDPNGGGVKLEIRADVHPDLTYEPRFVRLITDDPAVQVVKVWFTGMLASDFVPGPPEIRGERQVAKYFEVRPLEEARDGGLRRGFELRFKKTPPWSGSAAVVVKTGLTDPPELGVPFSWGESVKLRSQAK